MFPKSLISWSGLHLVICMQVVHRPHFEKDNLKRRKRKLSIFGSWSTELRNGFAPSLGESIWEKPWTLPTFTSKWPSLSGRLCYWWEKSTRRLLVPKRTKLLNLPPAVTHIGKVLGSISTPSNGWQMANWGGPRKCFKTGFPQEQNHKHV